MREFHDAALPAVNFFWLEAERKPKLAVVHMPRVEAGNSKIARHHADHGVRLAIEMILLPSTFASPWKRLRHMP